LVFVSWCFLNLLLRRIHITSFIVIFLSPALQIYHKTYKDDMSVIHLHNCHFLSVLCISPVLRKQILSILHSLMRNNSKEYKKICKLYHTRWLTIGSTDLFVKAMQKNLWCMHCHFYVYVCIQHHPVL